MSAIATLMMSHLPRSNFLRSPKLCSTMGPCHHRRPNTSSNHQLNDLRALPVHQKVLTLPVAPLHSRLYGTARLRLLATAKARTAARRRPGWFSLDLGRKDLHAARSALEDRIRSASLSSAIRHRRPKTDRKLLHLRLPPGPQGQADPGPEAMRRRMAMDMTAPRLVGQAPEVRREADTRALPSKLSLVNLPPP